MSIALRMAFLIGLTTTSAVIAKPSFQGDWLYHQECGFWHSAELHLVQQGEQITGTWSDGIAKGTGHGSFGSLHGAVMQGALHVNFCEAPDSAGKFTCPTFNTSIADRFVIHGNDLTWFRQSGGPPGPVSFDKYITLHRVIQGRKPVADTRCPDDAP